MDLLSNEIVAVLTYLLPGFVAAWIFYGLTAFPKPSQFERIIQALIFTIFIQGLVSIVKLFCLLIGKYMFYIGEWSRDVNLICSIFFAFLLGFIFTIFSNNDRLHALLRRLRITKLTSYPSEWWGSFSKNQTYVVLHFYDGRRLYGWPVEWPNQPDSGHFAIADAEWLTEKESIKLEDVKTIIIPAPDIRFVEFMKLTEDEKYE